MIRFIEEETSVVFEEIPDEITLCLNITNCQNNCKGCHSPHLKQNIGSLLDFRRFDELLEKNGGITCLCFMGEGNDEKGLKEAISYLKEKYPEIKVALYSGRSEITDPFYWKNLDYLKIGPYMEEFGPLNKPTTNQRMYKRVPPDMERGVIINDHCWFDWVDITNRFWKR